jgi:hypothetical protein
VNKKIFSMFSILAVAIVFAIMLPAASMAQRSNDSRYQDRDRDRDYRDRHHDHDRDNDDSSRYERRYSKQQIHDLVRRIESNSNRFRSTLDHELDRSRLNGSRREDNINADVRRFEEAFNRLRDEFDRSERWWESRRNVSAALDAARPVATRLRNNHISSTAQNQWRYMLRDLNELAGRYNLPRLA